jgi:hypothetical protein
MNISIASRIHAVTGQPRMDCGIARKFPSLDRNSFKVLPEIFLALL